MSTKVRDLIEDTRGNFVEYVILVGLIAIVGIAGYRVFGQNVEEAIRLQAGSVSEIPTTPPRGGGTPRAQ